MSDDEIEYLDYIQLPFESDNKFNNKYQEPVYNSNPDTYTNTNKNQTVKWIDLVPKTDGCEFCGSFYSTICVVCGLYGCDPKPNISIDIKCEPTDAVINTIQFYYDLACENKNYEYVRIIINTLNKYNIKYDWKYIYDFDISDINLFPKYSNLVNQLELAIKNYDLNKVKKIKNLDVGSNESILLELIKINSKYSFESTYTTSKKIANIIIQDFVQIKKELVLKCIVSANIHLIKLFIQRCILDEDIYIYVSMLGYIGILRELDKMNCPKNYLALIAVASNDLVSLTRRIKVMKYLINNGSKSIPKKIITESNIRFDLKILDWLNKNCDFY
jgi:hypothetical protein